MKNLISFVSLAAGLVMAGGAAAQGTWTTGTSSCTQQSAATGSYGNEYKCGATGPSLTAWSNERGTGSAGQAGSGWANAHISPQGTGSFGVANRTELIGVNAPNHSIDNTPSGGVYDFIMVKFDSAVILDRFGISWGFTDSDITLMRWNGTSAPTFGSGTSSMTGDSDKTLTNTLGSSGWQLVNSYDGVCKNSSNVTMTGTSNSCNTANSTQTTGATVGSSYWLISAYNTTMDATSRGWQAHDDGFKLSFLSAKAYTCPGGGAAGVGGGCGGGGGGGGSIPEPGSLALAGVALLGAFGARRRLGKKA